MVRIACDVPPNITQGAPLAGILHPEWEETFLVLGYVGLILIVFEGGMTTRLDLLRKNAVFSVLGATTGVCFPIGFSFIMIYLAYGYTAVDAFVVGAALSATSLGTTFTVISSTAKNFSFVATNVGSLLICAAVIDDVSGLIMASVISQLGDSTANLGWVIGRPIVASAAITILTPLTFKYIAAPFFRKFIESKLRRSPHKSNFVLMVLILCAYIVIAYYAGTSMLFGAYIAGVFIRSISSRAEVAEDSGPGADSRVEERLVTCAQTFERLLRPVQSNFFEPLFFATMGIAIPFLEMWTGKMVWRGILFSILMYIGKVIVGCWIPLGSMASVLIRRFLHESSDQRGAMDVEGENIALEGVKEKVDMPHIVFAALILGHAMVARGEIGLLILQIGYNDSHVLQSEAFLIGIWAIVVNTIIGPVFTSILARKKGLVISNGPWGL